MPGPDRIFITHVYLVSQQDEEVVEQTGECGPGPRVLIGTHHGTPRNLEALLRQRGHRVHTSIFDEEHHRPTALYVVSESAEEPDMLGYARELAELCAPPTPATGLKYVA